MAILFFDTETSDMIDRRRGPGPHQPHIVQLAALLVDAHEESSLCTLVRPDGWTVAPGAQKVHGISTKRAAAEGVPLADAIAAFHDLARRAEMLVAHNIDFDRLVVLSEYVRLGRISPGMSGPPNPFAGKREFCTMRASTDLVRLPGPYGFKWPSLQEAYRHFTGRDLDKAHDALADVRACRAIYEAIVGRLD
ncbi:MAG: exonuclease domain-containing protein [Phycisphaerae bacterium]